MYLEKIIRTLDILIANQDYTNDGYKLDQVEKEAVNSAIAILKKINPLELEDKLYREYFNSKEEIIDWDKKRFNWKWFAKVVLICLGVENKGG